MNEKQRKMVQAIADGEQFYCKLCGGCLRTNGEIMTCSVCKNFGNVEQMVDVAWKGKTNKPKWLSNVFKKEEHHFMNHVTGFAAFRGRPQATDKYSIEELEGMGMVGIFTRTDKPKEPARSVETCLYCQREGRVYI